MKSVCILGSQRFKEEMESFARSLRIMGVPLVYEPEFKERDAIFLNLTESERLSGEDQKNKEYRRMVPGLVFHHLQRIREADVVYVYNPGGYIGVNTTLEIGAAHMLNKPIFAMCPEKPYKEGGEMCREILVNSVVPTFEELCKKLI